MATYDGDANKHTTLRSALEKQYESLGQAGQFLLLVGGVFFFFGIHNLLQETMMAIDGFNFGIMLGYMEVFG